MGHKIEIFSAGCAICEQTIDAVRELVGADDEVHVHDMHQKETAIRAKQIGIRSLPAVIVDDNLTGCCAGGVFGAGHPHAPEPTSPGDSEAVDSSGLPADHPAGTSTDSEKVAAELRSEIYAGLVGLAFTAGADKASSVQRLRKACCKLNDLTVKTTLTSS